jgi:peptidyl-prolyl cis-trans isomerase D
MLGIMRKYKQSIIIKGVFAIIVLSFIGTIFLVWGTGEKGLGKSDYAVKVGRTKISYEQFQENYNRLRNMYQQLSNQPLTPEMEKQLGLKKLAIENVVNTALMRNEAKRTGVTVSKEEVINAIAAIPAFQKDGAFNAQIYHQLLQANHLTPQVFEEGLKEELLLKKVRQQVMDRVSVSDAEALQIFKKQRDRVELSFVSFSPAGVKPLVKLTDSDLNMYLQNHRNEFKIPEQVSISYVLLTPAMVASGLNVTNDDMLTYYQKNIDRYQDKGNILPFEEVKERVRTDALRFKAAKLAYEKAADALNRNLKSADLDAAARTFGLKVEKTSLFALQQPPAPIAGEGDLIRKSFALRQGELGGPVETNKGVYLFKIIEKKPSTLPALAQVRPRVEKLASDEKARELANRKAMEAVALMSQGKTPENLKDTGPFSFSGNGEIPGIGKSPEIMEAAFALTQAAPVPKVPFKSGETWYAVKLKKRTDTDTKDFPGQKEQIKLGMLQGKREEAVVNWLKDLRNKTKIEINPLLLAE